MQVASLLLRQLVLLHRNAIALSVGIMADAGGLPRDLHAGFAAANYKLIVADLLGYNGLSKLPNHG